MGLRYFAVGGGIILASCIAGVSLFVLFLVSRPVDLRETIASIDAAIDGTVREADTAVQPAAEERKVVRDRRAIWLHISRAYRLSLSGARATQLVNALRQAVKQKGAELATVSEDPNQILISITLEGLETHTLKLLIKSEVPEKNEPSLATKTDNRSAIAIIVDDLGYGGEATELLFSLQMPLTVSVLPQLPASRTLARRARALGFEVMLHLPMEADGNEPAQPGELRIGMSRDMIARIIKENLTTVPGAIGVNNHRGSKMTQLEAEMIKILPVLADNRLYFVDSLTTPESVALRMAKKTGLRTIGNDTFLDNDGDGTSMQDRIEELMRIAETRGYAVGICHSKPATMKVLGDFLSMARARGFEFVRVSELMERMEYRHARSRN
jgi:hypothetical protein